MAQRIRGKVAYLFILLITLNLIYPISEMGQLPNLIFVTLYAAMLGISVYTIAVNRQRAIITSLLAFVTVVLNVLWVLNPNLLAITIGALLSLIVFQGVIIFVLLEFIFAVPRITRDALFAAVSVYLLIGDLFIPLHTTIDLLTRASMGHGAYIITSTPEAAITWQKMVYFSFITLTSTGYGDILPITSFAQAVAAFDAVIGVLYIAVLMARLVSLYTETLVEARTK